MKMNLPNKLTMLRILLIPVFMVVLYLGFPGSTYVALGIFIIASLTDLLDGWIARRFDMVTEIGKILDPLADKATQLSLMLCLLMKYPILQPVLLLQRAWGYCGFPRTWKQPAGRERS